MKVVGAIIAGGKGIRLGGSKPLSPFRGSTLIDAVIDRAAAQVEELAVNIRSEDAPSFRARLGEAPMLFDDGDGGDVGPLAGVLAALDWAAGRGAQWLATFPADTPFLPRNLVIQLLRATNGPYPAAAHDGNRLHGLCAVWPVSAREALGIAVRDLELRSLHQAIAQMGGRAQVLACPSEAFFNVNTPEDLDEAERIARVMPEL